MPISLLEAMSFGCCCLTSDIDECTEVCEDKALYFEKSNTEDLKGKLSYLLENRDIIDKYRENSAKKKTKKYNWDEIAEKTFELYKKQG